MVSALALAAAYSSSSCVSASSAEAEAEVDVEVETNVPPVKSSASPSVSPSVNPKLSKLAEERGDTDVPVVIVVAGDEMTDTLPVLKFAPLLPARMS
jgi:hypothetical protein